MKKTVAHLSRRHFLQLGALAGVSLIGLPHIAFAQDATATTVPELPPAPAAGPIDVKSIGGLDKLIEAAKAEGELSTIALADNWADYGDIKKNFFAKYPFLKYNDLAPEASSAEEVEAIRANAGNSGPQNPDLIDVGFIWGAQSKDQGLLQPYKVETWDTIPTELKDAEGYWYGNYYGSMAFEVNADAVPFVPQDWKDLLDPRLKGLITIGDPVAASQSTHAVWAAALSNGGTLDTPEKGLEFYKQLAESGNLVPTSWSVAAMQSGELPITLRWDYNALADRDANKDKVNVQVIYPATGTIAGVYVFGISAYAPRPNAARLWMEYAYSDEGQSFFAKGYARPVRFDDMQKRNVIPEEILKNLPQSTAPVAFPKLDQLENGLQYIRDNWAKEVGIIYGS